MQEERHHTPQKLSPILSSTWLLVGLLSLPVLLWLTWQLRTVAALALLSLLLALGLAPVMAFLERHRLPRSLAVAVLYLGILLAAGALFFIAGNIIVTQSQALLAQLPDLLARWQAIAAENPLLAPPQVLQNLLPSGSLRLAGAGISSVLAGLLVLVVTYYLLMDGRRLWAGAVHLTPAPHRTMINLLGQEIARRTRGYLLGVTISGLVIGVVTTLGLWALGIPYPIVFGLLAGVLEAVPLVGPIVAVIGPLLLALGLGPLRAGLVLVFFVALQQVEDKLLVVCLQSHTTGLHPLVVIFSLLSLGVLFGFSGVVLAIPVAAAIQATVVCLNSCFYQPGGSSAWLAERQGDHPNELRTTGAGASRMELSQPVLNDARQV